MTATATVSDDASIGPLIAFVKARAVGASPRSRDRDEPKAADAAADALAESALDLLCGLAAKRRDGGACRDAVVRRGGVAALGGALVAARNDEVAVRALIGLAMTTAHEAQREELVAVPGACAALTRATRSPDADVAGAAKALLQALGRDEALRPAVAAALRETQASGTAADLDSA